MRKEILDLTDFRVRDKIRKELCEVQGYRCIYCHGPLPYNLASIDNVIPKLRGGKDVWDNLVCCCQECNEAKGDLTVDQFMPEVQDQIKEHVAHTKTRESRRPHRFTPFSGLAERLSGAGKLPARPVSHDRAPIRLSHHGKPSGT